MQLSPGEIVCPHCFKIFRHNEVHFRSAHAYDNGTTSQHYIIATEAMIERHSGPMYISGKYYALKNESQSIVTFAVDEYGSKSSVRLCPHCHGELLEKSGLIDFYAISIIGEPNSGKSVYRDALASVLMDELPNLDLGLLAIVEEEGCFKGPEPIENFQKGVFNYADTPYDKPITPVVLRVMSITEHRDLAYFAIYDSPGRITVKGEFRSLPLCLLNSDAAILLIDPLMTGLKDEINSSIGAPAQPAQQSYGHTTNVFRLVRRILDSGCCKHFAFAISKSDLLEYKSGEALKRDSKVFQKCRHNGGFDEEEARAISEEAELLLKEANPQLLSYLSFVEPSMRSFFCLSSLGHIHEQGREPSPRRVEEPILWLFNRLGLISVEEKPKEDEFFWEAPIEKPKLPLFQWLIKNGSSYQIK